MRILVLSQMYPRLDAPTFAGFIERQVAALAAEGVWVQVCAPMMNAPPIFWWRRRWRSHGQVALAECRGGVKVVRTRYWSPPGMRLHFLEGRTMRWSVLHETARWAAGGVDLIHTNRLFPEGVAATALGRALGVPVVAMARGSDLNLLPAWGEVYRRELQRVVQELDGLLSVSRALLDDLTQFAELPAALPRAVVYNGVDSVPPATANERRQIRARFHLPAEACLAVYVGRLEPAKGTPELLRAFGGAARRVPELHLAAVGEVRHADYRRDIAAAGLGERVHFLGARTHAEVGEVMRAGDLFVFPSRREGVPNAVLEAMASGLSVAATRAGGITEVVPEDAGVLVDVGDIDGLEQAIVRLARSPQLRGLLGARGRAHVAQHHTWAQNARGLLKFYGGILDRRLGVAS